MRSFADTCCSGSGSGSRMNLFGEPPARTNDPAAIAPAAAVWMNFRREFFSALLSDLRISGLLRKRVRSPAFRRNLQIKIHAEHQTIPTKGGTTNSSLVDLQFF